MDTKDGIARTKTYRKLATVRVFHQAFREIGKLLQTPNPTYLRIRKTPQIAADVVVHAPTLASPASHSGELLPPRLRPAATIASMKSTFAAP
jgi:hypothetical protein